MDATSLPRESRRMTPGRDAADDIRAAERARLRALVEPDLDRADAVHAQDYQLITPGGAVLSKQEYLGAVATGELDYRTFEAVSDVAVRAGEHFGVVRYRARIEVWVSGNLDEGTFWHTDTYEFRDAAWQAVWSQATRIRNLAGES